MRTGQGLRVFVRKRVERRPGVLVIGFMSVLGPKSRNVGRGGGPIETIGGIGGGSKLRSAAASSRSPLMGVNGGCIVVPGVLI